MLMEKIFALNFELPVTGFIPEQIMLVPSDKTIKSRDGRTYLNDNPLGIIEYFNRDGRHLPFDWVHATELKAPKGEAAPAAAWGKQGTMKLDASGAISIQVEWTPMGKLSVLNKEYRYISPVYLCEPNTMRIRGISSVGLTNKPNLLLSALNAENPSNAFKRKLTDQETAICQIFGNKPEEYLKTITDEESTAITLSQLNSADLSLCHSFGINPKDYMKSM